MSNLLRIIKARRIVPSRTRESPKNLTPEVETEEAEEDKVLGTLKKLETDKEIAKREAEELQEKIEKLPFTDIISLSPINPINIRAKDKGTVVKMTPSGCNSDGVLEFYAQKPDDMKLHAGHGYLSGCSMSFEEMNFLGRFKTLKITVTIEEDPRLKAWSLYSAFGVNSYGIIKHCPRKIFCGHFTAQPYKIKGEGWNDESDTFGRQNQTWEPYTLEFKPEVDNEIGMIRGNDDYWNLSAFQRHLAGDPPKGYYDFDDQIKEVQMFGKDTQGFEHDTGISILDKINKERWDNSITPLTADSSMMMIAESHAYYLADWDRETHSFLNVESECVKRNINYFSFADEIESKLAGVEFTEYNRVVFCKRNILAVSSDSINYESILDEAMIEWLGEGTAPDHILRNSYNSAGFGVVTVISQYFVTQVQHYWNVYICVDLGTLSNIGTRQTSQEALETVEGPPVEQTESRASYAEKLYGDNYSFEIDTKAKFALDSHNPICRTYTLYDWHPIPYAVYYLYGHYNDLSVLNAEQTHLTDYESWPSEKKARWQMDNVGIQPDMDPRNYPALMLEQRYNTSYLETGLITKGPYRYHYGDFWRYEVNGKDVNGLSKTKYSIGDWVVIQKGLSGYGDLQTVEWFILPSSPYYHVNVHEDKEGVS